MDATLTGSMLFEEGWEVARYNGWQLALWVITFGCSVAIGAAIGAASRAPLYRVRWGLMAAAAIALLLATITASVRSIEMKWQQRFDAATTDREFQAVADRDGANRAFAPIIGSFYGAVAATLCCGSALLVTLLRSRTKSEEGMTN